MNDQSIPKAVAVAIQARLGDRCQFFIHEPPPDSAMGHVLAEAESQGAGGRLIWARQSAPDMFCLAHKDSHYSVFSQSYLEHASAAHVILRDDLSDEVRKELVKRFCLNLMAQFAALSRDYGLAADAFMLAETGRNFVVPTHNMLLTLEGLHQDERYMALWFFGLTHELGHSMASAEAMPNWDSDEILSEALEFELANRHVGDKYERVADLLHLRSLSGETRSLSWLREEIRADAIAASITMRATQKLMASRGATSNVLAMVAELYTALQTSALIQSCKRTVRLALNPDRAVSEGILAWQFPSTLAVRLKYLLETVRLLVGARSAEASDAIWNTAKQFEANIACVEAGLGEAMQLALFPWRRPMGIWRDYFEFAVETPSAQSEARYFLGIVDFDSCGGETGIELLRSFCTRSSEPLAQVEELSQRYFCLAVVDGEGNPVSPIGPMDPDEKQLRCHVFSNDGAPIRELQAEYGAEVEPPYRVEVLSVIAERQEDVERLFGLLIDRPVVCVWDDG